MAWSVRDKTVVITGGNTGIGLAAAHLLAAEGADVVITSRSEARGEEALRHIKARAGRNARMVQLDLASFASIRSCAERLGAENERIDVLINNAGLIMGERTTTEEGFETTFGVNHLGHFLLTSLLEERIKASAPSRIINVSSDAHLQAGGLDFDDLQSEKSYVSLMVYARSKLANLLYAREHARLLEGTGVSVFSMHPGVVATRFSRDGDASGLVPFVYKYFGWALRTPEKGAATAVHLAVEPELEGQSGGYYKNCRPGRISKAARSDEAARRLWDASEALIAGV